MTKKILIFTLSTSLLFAYSDNDWDWDGVEDKDDKCPYSQFTDIVDKDGCRVKSTQSEHHFDILLGVSQIKNDSYENTSTALQLDYYYRDFTLSLSNSQYNYDSVQDNFSTDGQADYFLTSRYRIKASKKLSIYLKAGAIIPADTSVQNNKTDFLLSSSLNYKFSKDFTGFAGYTHYFINNEDTNTTSYQDSDSFYFGTSYRPNTKSDVSLSYAQSSSIYDNADNLQFLYLTGSYYFNRNWFTMFTFGQELEAEDKEQYLSAQIGYYF